VEEEWEEVEVSVQVVVIAADGRVSELSLCDAETR
jgi:hypothetical protein